MRKKLFMVALVAMAMAGCSKDDDDISRPQCEVNDTGTLSVQNLHEDPYQILLNGGYRGTVGAYQTELFSNITAGTYTGKAIQASGYILYATEYNISITITQCQTNYTVF